MSPTLLSNFASFLFTQLFMVKAPALLIVYFFSQIRHAFQKVYLHSPNFDAMRRPQILMQGSA
jgi:hypothetical protein